MIKTNYLERESEDNLIEKTFKHLEDFTKKSLIARLLSINIMAVNLSRMDSNCLNLLTYALQFS